MTGLDCVERPLFTAGMVLSDSDLTALVEWTRARLALQRFRTGWGVAGGLDVRCDPGRPGWVRVEPGAAAARDGADIVVCEPVPVDLTGCCRTGTPCGTPSGREGDDDEVVVDLVLTAADTTAGTGTPGTGTPRCGCGCGCGPAADGPVLVTRVREGAQIHACRVAMPAADPTEAAAQRRQAGYTACHALVGRYVREGSGDRSAEDVIAWLGKQPGLEPPCDWWDRTCAALRAAKPDGLDAAVAHALLELVVAGRHRLLRRGGDPGPDEPLRLARVWLRGKDCRVVAVDPYPPYRRELGPDTGPVPPGWWDLTPYVWQRWAHVLVRWRALTGEHRVVRTGPPSGTESLLKLLDSTDRIAWDAAGVPPVPVVLAAGRPGERVLGFQARVNGLRARRKPAS